MIRRARAGYRPVDLTEHNRSAWQTFVTGNDEAWITHHPTWCLDCCGDRRLTHDFAIADGDGRLVAVVPAARRADQPILVSGLIEPAGPALDPTLTAEQRGIVWQLIDIELVRRARSAGCTRVLLKTQLLGSRGLRPERSDSDSLGRLGYAIAKRSFFYLDLTETEEQLRQQVSPRTRTQIRTGAVESVVVKPDASEGMDALFDVYAKHSATKGRHPTLSPASIAAIKAAGPAAMVVPLLFMHRERPAAFSISVGLGSTASLFAWGAVPDSRETHVAKFAVWESLMALRMRGVTQVEYGGAITTSPYAGLTEFYRRFGGTVRSAAWALKKV